MSFMLTTEQARNKIKDVTRRNGWWFLKPGDIVQQVEKCRGLKKGEKVKKIHLIRIVFARPELLQCMIDDPEYGLEECRREGFPDTAPQEFVDFCCRHNKVHPDESINRIEVEYL
ncbi:MAG: ASCH domain-containing protein [Deltaproteobacteria bacterium]|nr:ASCH domain-containing protein [Deltaproteobacteria bacterium]